MRARNPLYGSTKARQWRRWLPTNQIISRQPYVEMFERTPYLRDSLSELWAECRNAISNLDEDQMGPNHGYGMTKIPKVAWRMESLEAVRDIQVRADLMDRIAKNPRYRMYWGKRYGGAENAFANLDLEQMAAWAVGEQVILENLDWPKWEWPTRQWAEMMLQHGADAAGLVKAVGRVMDPGMKYLSHAMNVNLRDNLWTQLVQNPPKKRPARLRHRNPGYGPPDWRAMDHRARLQIRPLFWCLAQTKVDWARHLLAIWHSNLGE